MRATIYFRVSTAEQTPDNQERELRAAAERMGTRWSRSAATMPSGQQGPGRAPGLRGPAIRTLPAARSTWSWRGRSIGSGAATCSPSSSTCARPWFFLHAFHCFFALQIAAQAALCSGLCAAARRVFFVAAQRLGLFCATR